ncbi:MAG: TetR/AcrR family transcriptional regulator [Levilactobacillus brevis]
MQTNQYQDLRVQRTINSIYDAFEQLICEKDYQKITVTELARRAQVNKKTFYRYYPTLDDLLIELQA